MSKFNILDHIFKARKEAIRRAFGKSVVIIDTDLAITSCMYISEGDRIFEFPPMIMGMEVVYEQNLTKDCGFNFIIAKDTRTQPSVKELSDYTTQELLDEISRRLNNETNCQ